MKKRFKIIIIVFSIITIIYPISIQAKANYIEMETIVNKKFDPEQTTNNDTSTTSIVTDCESILGDVNNEEDLAWLLQKLLNYIKILGPALAIVLGSVDFVRAIIASDEESMKKSQKRFIYRLVAAMLLFLIPTLTGTILQTFGIMTSNASCGIK